VSAEESGESIRVDWQAGQEDGAVRWWVVQVRGKGMDGWTTAKILPRGSTGATLRGTPAGGRGEGGGCGGTLVRTGLSRADPLTTAERGVDSFTNQGVVFCQDYGRNASEP